MRPEDNRRPLRATELVIKGNPPREGKRGRGWQNVRWVDEIKKFSWINWSQLAQESDNWKSMGEALALLWALAGW